jgi:hypothetical protein
VGIAFIIIGCLIGMFGALTFVSGLFESSEDVSLGARAILIGVAAATMLGGYAMIRWGRSLRVDPTPAARRTARGGCLGSLLGAVAFFFVCFLIVPEGEGQLSCLVFPLFGALVGLAGGAMIGLLAGPRRRPRSDSARGDVDP